MSGAGVQPDIVELPGKSDTELFGQVKVWVLVIMRSPLAVRLSRTLLAPITATVRFSELPVTTIEPDTSLFLFRQTSVVVVLATTCKSVIKEELALNV